MYAPDGVRVYKFLWNCFAKFSEDKIFLQFMNGSWVKSDSCNIYSRTLEDVERIVGLMKIESNLREKIKDIGYSYRRVEKSRDELLITKFKKFNEEECWIYQGDGGRLP